MRDQSLKLISNILGCKKTIFFFCFHEFPIKCNSGFTVVRYPDFNAAFARASCCSSRRRHAMLRRLKPSNGGLWFFFACFAVQWIQGPIFICACSSALRTAQRHSWLRWHRPRSERSNPRSWTHYPRAYVITYPSRAYSISSHPAFVSHFRFGLSCVVAWAGAVELHSLLQLTPPTAAAGGAGVCKGDVF